MRYAILSDLHANLQAWNAVFLDLRSNGADRVIALGDLVGYGPQPAEVLESVHQHVDHLVLGNHDAVVCGKLDEGLFNETARDLIRWTRARLGANAVRFLDTLPLTLAGEGFRCAHGDFVNPAAFPYLLAPTDALLSWNRVTDPLLFVGHTHEPALYVLGASGTPHAVEPQDFEMEPGKRYLLNVGSVGSPRDGDARASYCLYDTEQRSVYWRRVPFDLDAFRAAVKAVGITDAPSYFLHHDPRCGRRPIRELLSFQPPTAPEQAVQGAVEVQTLTALRRSVSAWRRRFVAVLLLAVLAGAGTAALVWRHQTRTVVRIPSRFETIDARTSAPGANLTPIPGGPTAPGQAVPGWTVTLGNRHRQTVRVLGVTGGETSLELQSATTADPIDLASPPILVEPGMAFYPEALFLKQPGFSGSIALTVSLVRQTGGKTDRIEQFYVKEPTQSKAGGWLRAREKFEIPAGGSSIQFHIRGQFNGIVQVKGLELTCKR